MTMPFGNRRPDAATNTPPSGSTTKRSAGAGGAPLLRSKPQAPIYARPLASTVMSLSAIFSTPLRSATSRSAPLASWCISRRAFAETTSIVPRGVQSSPAGSNGGESTTFDVPALSTVMILRPCTSENQSLPACQRGHSGNTSPSSTTRVVSSILRSYARTGIAASLRMMRPFVTTDDGCGEHPHVRSDDSGVTCQAGELSASGEFHRAWSADARRTRSLPCVRVRRLLSQSPRQRRRGRRS